MVPNVPEEIRKLEKICDPYIKACKLVDDAPEEVKEAKKKSMNGTMNSFADVIRSKAPYWRCFLCGENYGKR